MKCSTSDFLNSRTPPDVLIAFRRPRRSRSRTVSGIRFSILATSATVNHSWSMGHHLLRQSWDKWVSMSKLAKGKKTQKQVATMGGIWLDTRLVSNYLAIAREKIL